MNLEKYILPYPYSAYDANERRARDFESYKRRIFGWVENSTKKAFVAETIYDRLSMLPEERNNKMIKDWILSHIDKVRYIYDFSGLDFGIQVFEEENRIVFTIPGVLKEDEDLYPDYDLTTFRAMTVAEKLDWFDKHLEFIPFRSI